MMVGVVLAAGASRRMGSPKPLVRVRGETFLTHGIRHLWTACDVVVVVLGSKGPKVRAAIEAEFERLLGAGQLTADLVSARRHGATGLEVRFVDNPRWKRGMYESVRVGLRAALRYQPSGVMVLPVDHPAVKPETVRDLGTVLGLALEACKSGAERKQFSYALVPRYRRERGHPVALTAALARAVATDARAENLSDAVRRHARLIGFLDVADRGVVVNRNRPRSR